MPHDSPATDAGTDERPPRTARAAHDVENDHDTPDSWAPVNRRTMRDDVDFFRNRRMPIPGNRFDALTLAALALEYYEHAHEVATRTARTVLELEAETLVDPFEGAAAEHYRVTLHKKGEADKELAVADRRHATALAYLNTFKGE